MLGVKNNVIENGPDSGKYTFKQKANKSISWQAIAGVGFDIEDVMKIDVQYRYIHLGKLKAAERTKNLS